MPNPAMKRCISPDHTRANPLPVAEFGKDSSRRDGLTSRCRECLRSDEAKARRRYPEATLERKRATARQWHAEHPAIPGQAREKNRRYNERKRNAVFDHYGRVCACCASTDELTIDHIRGDGKEHRALLGLRGGVTFYRWLVANGFPEGFQALCWPCNRSKAGTTACRLVHELKKPA